MQKIFRIILKQICRWFQQNFFFASCIGGILALGYFWVNKKKKNSWSKKIFKSILFGSFGFYFYVVLDIVLLSRNSSSSRIVNMEFLGTLYSDTWSQVCFVENMLLLLPLGVLLPIIFSQFRRWWICIGSGLLCSISIEFLQYITGRGRYELDDIWCNTLGCMLGFVFISLCIKCNKQDKKEGSHYERGK